jgi:hypothetical protein
MLHSLQRRARTSTYSNIKNQKQEIAPRERVLDEIRESVENSTNSANLLQLEKSLNSAYSLFSNTTEENGSTTTNNAPSNKLRRNNQGLFRQRESMTE